MEKKNPEQHSETDNNDETPERRSKARRRLLQSLAMGGAAVTVKSLPERWTKPILNDAILPAHAEASPEPDDCDLACRIGSAQDTDESNGNAISTDGIPAVGGGVADIQNFGDESAFSFNQITATVSENCTGSNVDLQVNLNVNVGGGVGVDPTNQDRPIVGGVATFNEVTVNLPALAGDDGAFGDVILAGSLGFVFSTAGAEPDCVITVNFEEVEGNVNCLLHGSSVLMADDRCEEIQNLQLGQLVRATDIPDSTTPYGVITKLIKNHRREGYYVINDELRITNDHPVLVLADKPVWRRVDELSVGDVIKSMHGYTEIRSCVYQHNEVLTVYMETNTDHFIVKGKTGNYVVKSAYAGEAQVLAMEKHAELIST